MSRRRNALFYNACTITRKPTAGQTGTLTIATGLICSNPAPPNQNAVNHFQLATTFKQYELFTDKQDDVQKDDIVTLNGITYEITQPPMRWNMRNKDPFMSLIMQERTK